MLDLHLTSQPAGIDALVVGYACPCGCTPAVTYSRGTAVASDGCCCGNEFAVGPSARDHVHQRSGFELVHDSLTALWGERLPVVWAIGPSTHEASGGDSPHDHEEGGHAGHGEHDHGSPRASHVDPVCGMTVEPDVAAARGLHSANEGVDYFFCGKGCKLEFDDDPERYLDPGYVPSM